MPAGVHVVWGVPRGFNATRTRQGLRARQRWGCPPLPWTPPVFPRPSEAASSPPTVRTLFPPSGLSRRLWGDTGPPNPAASAAHSEPACAREPRTEPSGRSLRDGAVGTLRHKEGDTDEGPEATEAAGATFRTLSPGKAGAYTRGGRKREERNGGGHTSVGNTQRSRSSRSPSLCEREGEAAIRSEAQQHSVLTRLLHRRQRHGGPLSAPAAA